MKNLLEVLHLVKNFAEVRALDGISFSVREGEVYGLLGPNGAGKTTTINILSQVIRFNSGELILGDMNYRDNGPKIKQLIGVVPQEIALYPTLTAADNLKFFGGLHGVRGATLRQRAAEALALVGLQGYEKRVVDTFSTGMKRRLNIAAGLLTRPKLLLLDEPAVGVDPQSRNHILESIKSLNKERGITVLYTSHYMEEVEQICDRVAIIDKGKIIAEDEVGGLIDRFGGGAVIIRLDKDAGALADSLRGLDGVREVRSEGCRLSLAAENPQRVLPALIGKLSEGAARIEALELRRASLETVFLNLTGRSLRDK